MALPRRSAASRDDVRVGALSSRTLLRTLLERARRLRLRHSVPTTHPSLPTPTHRRLLSLTTPVARLSRHASETSCSSFRLSWPCLAADGRRRAAY